MRSFPAAVPAPAVPGTGTPFGVYVHIPFCAHRCDYCAFATWDDRPQLAPDYVVACRAEIDRAVAGGMPAATSVFFGGGTPSLLPAEDLVSILEAIPRRVGAEVTVECNPEHADPERLATWRRGGVTRLSFGVQSMVPAVLERLGRRHDPDAVRRAAANAGSAGFAGAYSVDLIFGAVGEQPADWEVTIAEVLALDPPPAHVSAYGLIPEPGTPLGADPTRHPDPDDQADKYLAVDAALAAAGYSWYEISNWAQPGATCRHNQLYWAQGAYRGFGCAAHSHEVWADGRARRWWNVRTPERYLRSMARGGEVVGGEEILDPATRAVEALELRLRTAEGVALRDVPAPEALQLLEDHGLVVVEGGPAGEGTGRRSRGGSVEVVRTGRAIDAERRRRAEARAGAGARRSGTLGGEGREEDRVRLTRRGRLLASEVTVRLLG